MMRLAVTSPTPGRVSSCSGVAVLRSRGADGVPPRLPVAVPASGGGRGVAGSGDPDLFAVGELAGEVDGVEVGAGGRAAGGPDGVVDPAAGGQADEARPADPPGHVDRDPIPGPGLRRRGGRRPGQGLVRRRDRPLAARAAGQPGRGPGPHDPRPRHGGQGEQRDRHPLAPGPREHRPDACTPAFGRQDERRRLRHGPPPS